MRFSRMLGIVKFVGLSRSLGGSNGSACAHIDLALLRQRPGRSMATTGSPGATAYSFGVTAQTGVSLNLQQE